MVTRSVSEAFAASLAYASGFDREVMIIRTAIRGFQVHYHEERNHQRLDNRLIQPSHTVGCPERDVECRERLSAVPPYCYRDAA